MNPEALNSLIGSLIGLCLTLNAFLGSLIFYIINKTIRQNKETETKTKWMEAQSKAMQEAALSRKAKREKEEEK